MIEEWKDIYYKDIFNDEIIDYRGYYQINNNGEIRSLISNKILKQTINKKGYCIITLYKNNIRKTFRISRLVAYMFIPNPENKLEVDHINTIKTDNRVENLRWTTSKENSNNPLTIEKYRNRKHLKHKDNILISRYDLNNRLIDIKECSEYVKMGFISSKIYGCCRWYQCHEDLNEWHKFRKQRPIKSHHGYIFKYYNQI